MEGPVLPYESMNGHQAASMLWENGVHQSNSSVAALSKDPPEYGLLSRTLIHSSVVKQILPARIRRDDLNDVVFIGETFVELHLLTEGGTLQQAGSKTNFYADIRQARVFGSQRRPNMSGVDQSVSIDEHESQDIKLHLPADILALTMDSGHLAFVYAKNCDEQGQVEFIVSCKRIDSKGAHPTHLGKSIAVDPRSRALAVSAYQDNFRIFSLHSMTELHRQMEEGLPLTPIKEEKSFEIKGLIIHMEFLYPSPDDDDHVILLLFLVDSNQQSRLQLYEWWASKPLKSAVKLGQNGLRLSEDITMPLLIIPLVISSSFLIVTEYSIHAMKVSDIMSGNAKIAKIPLGINSHDNLGSLVTAWARPFRAPVYSVSHDDMYLALENGQIYFLEVDSQAHMLVQTATNASKFDCAIGTAFACLDYGLGNDDMLVAGGEMSSGGIYLLKIAAYPKKESTSRMQESVTNWAPVFDFELVNLPAQGQSIGGATRDRVFAITGRGLHGAVTELRYGLQARIQGTADYVHGIKRLFILPDAAGRGYFVLSSLADCSEICFLSSVDGGNWNVCEGMSALDLSEPTLAAGPLEKHDDEKLSHALKDQWLRSWSVQITPTAIIAAHLHDEVEDPEDLSMENRYCDRKLQQRCKNGDTIVGAAIYRGFVLVAMRADESIQLILALIDVKRESDQFLVPIGNPWPMEDDPSFVSIVELRGYPFAIVGTRQATVRIYQIDKSTGLHSVYEQSMVESPEVVERDLCVCESAVVMETPDGAAKLLCGLRGGTVLVFDIITSANTLKTVKTREINFGPIPIQLQPDYCRRDSAFILAGPELYRFDMPKNSFRAAQIVFKDTEVDPVIQAITQIDNSPDPENIIVCATKDQIIYADVDRSENMCGRRLKLNETPRRVLFYRPLNVLIVACSRRADTTAGQKKTSLCTLKFIDPKTGADRELRDPAKNDTMFGRPDEQIYAITEWNMQLQGKPYRYLVIGTGQVTPELKKGRVFVLSLTTNSSGKIQLKQRFRIDCHAPVYSVCAFGDRSIIYCDGNQLCFKTLNIENLKLEATAQIKLRSPAVKMTVSEPFIHLSTAADSLLVVKFENDTLTECFSDEVARNGLNHFNLHPDFILASDKQYGLVGLWRPGSRRSLECLTTIFETELTSSISRIRQGHCRPPWATPNNMLPGVITGPSTIVAAGIDGSFFQLTLIDQKALLLLQYVQDIVLRQDDMGVRFKSSESNRRDVRAAHINGDMLLPIEKWGAGWLRHEVAKGSQVAETQFKDAAISLLGEVDDVWESVVLYIKGLLNDAVL